MSPQFPRTAATASSGYPEVGHTSIRPIGPIGLLGPISHLPHFNPAKPALAGYDLFVKQ